MNKIFHISFLFILVIYLFYGFSIDRINFAIFSFWGIFVAFMSLFISQIVLAARWMKMSNLSFWVSFETIIVSSALNMILPARLGELSKAMYLKKFYNFSYHKTLAIIFVEKFFDVIILFLLMCFWTYNNFSNNILRSSIIVLSIVLFFTVVFFNSKYPLFFLKRIPFQLIRVYSQKMYKNINSILKAPLDVFIYTFILWMMYLLNTILFFKYSVDFGLSFNNILELFIFSTIAMAIPLSPAGIGTFEASIVLYLTHLGIGKEDALVSATIFHFLIFAVDFVLLYLFLLIKDIRFKDLIKR